RCTWYRCFFCHDIPYSTKAIRNFIPMKGAHSKINSGSDAVKLTRAKSAGKTIAMTDKAAKKDAQAQFSKIKEALDEVDKIEAGEIKPKSLDELLDEL